MQRQAIVDEFTHQAQTFDRASVARAAETLAAIVDMVPADARGRWVDAACGTGTVTRALAPVAESVLGVDMTPAMLDVARREAAAAGLDNVAFAVGDATALPLPDGDCAGAVTRFSLHHIPVPGRVIAEMARAVAPGGSVIIGDHVTDDDPGAAAWHQEIERLRDPSHWACLRADRIRALGRRAGLVLEEERLAPVTLDFDDWLARGSAGEDAAEVIAACLAERPGGVDGFRVERDGDGRRLVLRYSLTRWRRPD